MLLWTGDQDWRKRQLLSLLDMLPSRQQILFSSTRHPLFLLKILLVLITGRVANLEIGSLVDLDSFAVLQQVSRGVHQVHLSGGARTTLTLTCSIIM